VRVSECNWQQVEAYLRNDDRAILPLGSTEQHAQLSLSVDSILSERVAAEAANPWCRSFPSSLWADALYRLSRFDHLAHRHLCAAGQDILDGCMRRAFGAS
jgi:creatinine amidohydrolase